MGKPFSKADVFNGAAPGENTDILASDLVPTGGATDSPIFRVTLALAVASVVNVMVDDGTTEFAIPLNANAAIPAEAFYREAFGVRKGYTYNFQVETDGVIRQLLVDECQDSVI